VSGDQCLTDAWMEESATRVQKWLLDFPSEAPAVVIPVYNAYEDVLECVESVLAATPSTVPMLVIDDASTDTRIRPALSRLSAKGQFLCIHKPTNSGFVGTINLAFAWCAPRDVVVINSDVVVPTAWLERLQAAAYYRSTIATATPLTNHGTIVSVPYRNQPTSELVGKMTAEEVDTRIRSSSSRLYPIIPTAVAHCVYFKRSALDVVGRFDEAFAPGYGEEVDFSQRAVLAGFSHVLADDLFVYHKGSRSFESHGQDRRRTQAAHEALIRRRYPWYADWAARAATDTQSPLARAIERAQAALLGHRVAIDATCIGGPITGTQVLTLELIRALATTPRRDVSLTVIILDRVDKSALLGLDQLVDEVVTPSDLDEVKHRFNLVHRPFQIRTTEELARLRRIAQRFIISQLDMIAFSNPGYASQPEEWMRYRRLARLACNIADGIVFISHDVAQDAAHHGIYIESNRAFVIPPGADHLREATARVVADSGDRLPPPPFILMLGTSFRHKNRGYALRLVQTLIKKYPWKGKLVFAGPDVASGGSEAEEALLLQHSPELEARVCYLGAVSQVEKQWLLKNASLLLYPSTCEGFGLVPFEAAAAGTPALTTRTASLGEVLGDDVIYLDTFDPEDGADLAWSFLSDATIAARQAAAIQARMADFTWSVAAARTLEAYQQVMALPPRLREEIVAPALSADPRDRLLAEGKALPHWRRRLALFFYIALAEGLRSLLRQIHQYIRWLARRWK
jgi:glycosyltransferase involved in cell wall biosynthesis/GT2 family glycosyltransferase